MTNIVDITINLHFYLYDYIILYYRIFLLRGKMTEPLGTGRTKNSAANGRKKGQEMENYTRIVLVVYFIISYSVDTYTYI